MIYFRFNEFGVTERTGLSSERRNAMKTILAKSEIPGTPRWEPIWPDVDNHRTLLPLQQDGQDGQQPVQQPAQSPVQPPAQPPAQQAIEEVAGTQLEASTQEDGDTEEEGQQGHQSEGQQGHQSDTQRES